MKFELVRRKQYADRAQRIGTNHHEISVGSHQRANDRREVGGTGRETFVVDDGESERLGVFAGTLASIARELGVLGSKRDGFRLGLLLHRDLEIAFGERLTRFRPGRNHREVSLVAKFPVRIETEQADQQLALLHDHRQRRRNEIGAIRPVDEIDLVDVEQLGVEARYVRWIRLIVVVHKLDLAAQKAALSVGLLFPDLGAEQCLLAVRRQWTGQRQAKADLNRIAGLRRGWRGRGGKRCNQKCSAFPAGYVAPGNVLTHAILPKGFVCNFLHARAGLLASGCSRPGRADNARLQYFRKETLCLLDRLVRPALRESCHSATALRLWPSHANMFILRPSPVFRYEQIYNIRRSE